MTKLDIARIGDVQTYYSITVTHIEVTSLLGLWNMGHPFLCASLLQMFILNVYAISDQATGKETFDLPIRKWTLFLKIYY